MAHAASAQAKPATQQSKPVPASPTPYAGNQPAPTQSGGADPNAPPAAGRLRQVPVVKTLLLGIITLGVYMWVRAFKCSGDLHRMPGGWGSWKVFFWLSIIPYLGLIFLLILYFKNNKQSNTLRVQRGLESTYLPFILAVIPIVNIAAPFVWASHYNELARQT